MFYEYSYDENSSNAKNAVDKNLIMLLNKNRSMGIKMLYEQYSAPLYGIIFRLVKSEKKSAEILQKLFLSVCEDYNPTNAKNIKLFTWMTRKALSLATESLDKEQYQIPYELVLRN